MKLMKIVGVMVALVMLCCAGTQAAEEKIVKEQDTGKFSVVRMHYIGQITPEVLKVAPGTTVIWMNGSKETLELQFEGKQVTMACKSPVHFVIDEKGSFVSDRIPEGSVASLCFVEKGEFSYVARKVQTSGSISQYRDSVKEFKGKVIVE